MKSLQFKEDRETYEAVDAEAERLRITRPMLLKDKLIQYLDGDKDLPRLAALDTKRHYNLSVWLEDKDFEELQVLSALHGMPLVTLVRYIVLHEIVIPHLSSKKTGDTDYAQSIRA